MELNQLLLAEMKREAAQTKKILACVPADKMDWRPHGKSMTLGRLASHIAEIPHWVNRSLENEEFDMLAQTLAPANCVTTNELLELFDTKLNAALEAVEKATAEQLEAKWVFRRGDFVISNGSRYEAIRFMTGNHQVHHRGQLSVYLRLLDVPIPGMYGPSADDTLKMQQAAAAEKN